MTDETPLSLAETADLIHKLNFLVADAKCPRCKSYSLTLRCTLSATQFVNPPTRGVVYDAWAKTANVDCSTCGELAPFLEVVPPRALNADQEAMWDENVRDVMREIDGNFVATQQKLCDAGIIDKVDTDRAIGKEMPPLDIDETVEVDCGSPTPRGVATEQE